MCCPLEAPLQAAFPLPLPPRSLPVSVVSHFQQFSFSTVMPVVSLSDLPLIALSISVHSHLTLIAAILMGFALGFSCSATFSSTYRCLAFNSKPREKVISLNASEKGFPNQCCGQNGGQGQCAAQWGEAVRL